MALTKSDKEFLTSSMKLSIQEELEPIRELLNKHQQTLHGPEGNNGMYGDVAYLKRTVSSLKRIYAVAGTVITGLLAFKDQILGGK